jgi:hypothetical protein
MRNPWVTSPVFWGGGLERVGGGVVGVGASHPALLGYVQRSVAVQRSVSVSRGRGAVPVYLMVVLLLMVVMLLVCKEDCCQRRIWC